MSHPRDAASSSCHVQRPATPRHGHRGFLYRWFLANSLIAGAAALAWLVLRSGTKPSRFVYPCQQAAFSTATLVFGVPLVAAVLAARRQVAAGLRTTAGVVLAGLGLVITIGVGGYLSAADEYQGPRLDPPRDYRAQIFQITDCIQDPIGDHFVGLDQLLTLMGGEGLKFYQSETTGPIAGPDGIIAADDVVVVKINYQWPERGGTNSDLLRGLIRRIVDHPDGFTGEIVVCENTQFASNPNFDRSQNNAQDITLSPHDVVVGFQSQGYTISHYDWRAIRYTSVDEYSGGDSADGYVVYPYDAQIHGRISYPKFRSDTGTYISLKYGLWNPIGGVYDRERLKFINAPLLKSHHATYGATACVKHYMGVVTGELSTSSHSAIAWGIMGALLGEIQMADLNILDCIWINANPYDGPWTSYSGATRRDILLASVDPVATDIWAVTNILIPAFMESGYSPPWPEPSADPYDPSSDFRFYLDNSMSQLLAAGYDVTNDLDQIDLFSWNGTGDLNCDGAANFFDIDAFVLAITDPDAYESEYPDCDLMKADCDGDGSVNFFDIDAFVALLMGG